LAQLNTARERALVAERIRCEFPGIRTRLLDQRRCSAPAAWEVRPFQGVSTASAEYQESYAGDNYDKGDDG